MKGAAVVASAFVASAVVALALAALPAPLAAQTAATVPLWDPAYRDLDRVVAAGLVSDLFVGQRPYSERRFADLAALAALELPGEPTTAPGAGSYLREAVARLQARFPVADDPDGFELLDARADATWAESEPWTLDFDNGRGGIDQVVHPLLAYRHGRETGEEGTGGLELSARATAGRAFAAEARPRLRVATGSDTDVDVVRAYGRVVAGNVAVLLGRDAVVWGQEERGGVLLSTNARGLDMVHLSNDDPVRLPWVLGVFGPSRFSFFGADLGSGQHFPHAKLFGAKWSARPHPRFEAGVSYLNKQGGEGSPDASLGQRIKDLLFFPDVLDSDEDFVFSEKVIGGEARWTLPTSTPAELYGEVAFTDFDVARFDQTLGLEAAYGFGLFLPTLGAAGRTWLRLEGESTGGTFYRHSQYRAGLTLDGQVLGSQLGPDARGFRLGVGHTTVEGHEWWLGAETDLRKRDSYAVPPDAEDMRAEKTAEGPRERRYRILGGWLMRLTGGGGTTVRVDGALERVNGFAFDEDRDETGFVVGVTVVRRVR